MRGAPQVGFSATIRKIKARTSLLTRFRPPTWLILETHVQYKRNPARCQFTTVLGVTKTRGCLHPDQHILNATQNSLCRAVNRRRGRCACRASNCRRRARFSRTRSARQLKELTNQPRKCRSATIMARILAEKTESSFAPSNSFRRCTTFWRGTTLLHLQALDTLQVCPAKAPNKPTRTQDMPCRKYRKLKELRHREQEAVETDARAPRVVWCVENQTEHPMVDKEFCLDSCGFS